jgi:Ser/Thr protein kinase RdoA (MazF antagonist)
MVIRSTVPRFALLIPPRILENPLPTLGFDGLTARVISDDRLRHCLADGWGLPDTVVVAHHGGMNSATWFVSQAGRRWVAKAVPPTARRSFAGGLAVAAALEAATGIPAGAPVPDRDGDAVHDVDGIPLALLSWVPGVALSGTTPDEKQLIGTTLARTHHALRDLPVGSAERFHWVDPRADHLSIRPWIRPAVAAAGAALAELERTSLTYGMVHTDPAPEAFRLDPTTGVCGLIDWSVAMAGPLLYDLASAVMYIGGPDRAGTLLAAYSDHDVVPRAEVERGLPVMLRFRWAVQADYFARRIATGDLTGIASAAENEAGLAHAHRLLSKLDSDQAQLA